MSKSIFESFAAGFEGGTKIARERNQQNALQSAATAFGAGDTKRAQSVLLSEGLLDEANTYGEMGERAKADQRRERIRAAMLGGGPIEQRYSRARDVAFGEGEFEMGKGFDDAFNSATDRQKQTAMEANDWLIQSLETLRGVPAEQRQARAMQMLQSGPFAGNQDLAAKAAQMDFSDAGIERAQMSALTVADQMNTRYKLQRDQIEDQRYTSEQAEDKRRWGAEFGLRQRAEERAIAEGRQMKLSDARSLRNDYEKAIQTYKGMQTAVAAVTPAARRFVASQGQAEGNEVNVRVQDGQLLVAAARLVNGPGVLSQQDVNVIQGAGLDSAIANAFGWASGDQMLSPRQRYALASIIVGQNTALEQQIAQTTRDHAEFARERGIDPLSVGIGRREDPPARPDGSAQPQRGERMTHNGVNYEHNGTEWVAVGRVQNRPTGRPDIGEMRHSGGRVEQWNGREWVRKQLTGGG